MREGLAKNEVASARNRQGAFSFSTLPTAAKFARQCGFGGFRHKYALSRQRADTGADRGLDGVVRLPQLSGSERGSLAL